MGDLVQGDDGLPASVVGVWANEKHESLKRYIDIASGVRAKYIGPAKAGATFIDLFCGPGRCLVRESGEWIDGGVVAAWKMSCAGGAPFSQVYIADLDVERRKAAAARLRQLGAPVVELEGSAVDAARQVGKMLNPYALHFAFLDPFSLGALNFAIIEALAPLKRMDILVHLNQMDLQRNLDRNVSALQSAFDVFAPGWRKKVNVQQSQATVRQEVIEYWRELVAGLGVFPSTEMQLIRGGRNQLLYWLLLAAKSPLAHRFWGIAANPGRQGDLFA